MPRTTLITAVYNRADLLPQAVESALAQSEPDLELIIWDDGSTDDSLLVAEHLATTDKRVRVFSAPNHGFTGALNAALAKSDSPYFGLVDSDDRLARSALEETIPIIESDPDIGIVYTNHQCIDMDGTVIAPGWNHDVAFSSERLIIEQMVFHFRLFRREIFDETGGYDPAYPHAEDYDMVLRMSEISDIVKHPATLYDYRIHPRMISSVNADAQRSSSLRAVEAALTRRGVADRLKVVVDDQGRFSLTSQT